MSQTPLIGSSREPDVLLMHEPGATKIVGGDNRHDLATTPIRDALRTATRAQHERLHRHAGFSRVKDGTISLPDYRLLLVRLYGFYVPFEHAVGADPSRTQWLERDLAALGGDAASVSRLLLCAELPRYESPARRLGALYVIEGSALGGRQLCRGLDHLLGMATIDGRCFFNGRGTGTGAVWSDFLDRLTSVGPGPIGRAAMVSAAIETFAAFETWLDGWSDTL